MAAAPKQQPSGGWQGRYRDALGGWHTKVLPTKTAARKWTQLGESAVESGTHRDPRAGRLTLRQWHDTWWATVVVERTTAARYRSQLDTHVLPYWEHYRLDAITDADVRAWVLRMQAAGTGAHTIKSCHRLLSGMLNSAVRLRPVGLIGFNPAEGVRLPPAGRKPERYLTHAEHDAVVALLAEGYPLESPRQPRPLRAEHRRPLSPVRRCQSDPMSATLVLLAAETGMRWGELVGLDVHWLDLLRGQVHIIGTMVEVAGGMYFKAYPKSGDREARPRTLPLRPEVVAKLAAYLQASPAQPVTLPDATPSGKPVTRRLVFTGRDGRPVRRCWNARVWLPAVRAAGLAEPLPTPNDLRHTFASWLRQSGVDTGILQQVMGHESSSTTERYTHLAPDSHDRVRAALAVRPAISTPNAARSAVAAAGSTPDVPDLSQIPCPNASPGR